ncbi:MAG: dodecin family protein [Oceanipulchritudo sp.]
MSEQVYKKVEVVGSSPESLEQAIQNAVDRAGKTLHNLRWFEVNEIRGNIENGKAGQWQVGVKIAFTLDDGNPA